MQFRIADTFTDSLARLTGEEQKAVKTTAFDLQLNSASPGLAFHKLTKAKDRRLPRWTPENRPVVDGSKPASARAAPQARVFYRGRA
jgi:hypothetical protein